MVVPGRTRNAFVEKLAREFESHHLRQKGENMREFTQEELEKLKKLTAAQLTDNGICPTCFNRLTNGAVYGDESQMKLYEDGDIYCMLVPNPRADGHAIIGTMTHYQDMSEAPHEINEKIIRFSKYMMTLIKKIYGCERVYLCTMCDGPANHYHIQLIPRYANEKRGSDNFVKPRKQYVHDQDKVDDLRRELKHFADSIYGVSLCEH